MEIRPPYELPDKQERERRHAIRLEWLTIGLQLTVVGALYLILGHSQAMRAAWIDDLLALIPPLSFLVATHFEKKAPNRRFPYGHYRAITAAFLITAVVLAWVGVSLFVESALKLIRQEHTPVGTTTLFGHQFWLGWLMEVGLAYSIVTEVILGRLKLPVARALHDKVLFADADMNRAGWRSESAAAIGILGIGLGYWWADPVAAVLISLDIMKDGWQNLSQSFRDLMDEAPRAVGSNDLLPLPGTLEDALKRRPWVRDAAVRLREEGHVFVGEAFVVPQDGTDLVPRIAEAVDELKSMDWRLYDLTIMPVADLARREATNPGSEELENG